MFEHILVVCIGNICRSPTAEIILRRYLPALSVASAGLQALVGVPIDATAQAVLMAHGFKPGTHTARQLDVGMMNAADLILAMDRVQLDAITKQAPHAQGRTFLLGKWRNELEIPDPYGERRAIFEQTFQLIDASLRTWLPYLGPSPTRHLPRDTVTIPH